MNLNRNVRMALIEAADKKEKLLIEEKLIKNKIMMIFESEDNIKYFDYLPVNKQKKIGKEILIELLVLRGQRIDEGLWDAITGIFGDIGKGVIQAIGEPFINSLLAFIGVPEGFFRNSLVSLLTKNWGRLGKAIKGDCKEITELLVEASIEALIMNFQQSNGDTGFGSSLFRNTIEEAIRGIAGPLEDQLMSNVCNFVSKITGKAQKIAQNQTNDSNNKSNNYGKDIMKQVGSYFKNNALTKALSGGGAAAEAGAAETGLAGAASLAAL